MLLFTIFLTTFVYAQTPDINFSQALHTTLKAHQSVKSYYDWVESPHHPHRLVESLAATNPSPNDIHQLCLSLFRLSPTDASIFYADLALLPNQWQKPCLKQFFKNQDLHLHAQSTTLMAQVYKAFPSDRAYLGPTRIEPVNTLGGPIFNYGEKGRLNTKEIALTFDDGPHPVLTEKLLQILKEEQLKAVFFLVGKNVDRYPEIVKKIASEGHTIANHSYAHKNLPTLALDQAEEEIENGFRSILNVRSFVAPFFRFPYGARTKNLTNYLQANDLASFFWDVDTLDWKEKNPQKLLQYTLQQIEVAKRGIVLFHDVQPQTIAMMPALLAELKAKNYYPVVYEPTNWIYLGQ